MINEFDNAALIDDVDFLAFADEDQDEEDQARLEKWKILIVDDEQEVHTVTKMVLGDFLFQDKSLNFLSAYTSEEAKDLITRNPDTAIILLDVVMEEDDAGLKVVKFIREELKNAFVRIILRTGQPGQAPEKKVIVDYDIYDYKEKTDLTAQKLFTTIVAALRSYHDINLIHMNKMGLERIIESSSSIFELQTLRKLASTVLTKLSTFFSTEAGTENLSVSGFATTMTDEVHRILATRGSFDRYMNCNVSEVISKEILTKLITSSKEKKNLYFDKCFVLYFRSKYGFESIVYFENPLNLSDLHKGLIQIFCTNVSIAFDNIHLNKEIENTQKEIIFTLGEIAEARSNETGNHCKRVAEYSKLCALKYGLPEDESEIIRLASPMHDVGKLGIPDAILNKPDKLTNEEFETIKTHSNIGYEMLKNSSRNIMVAAAIIAQQHHEKFNGRGYPKGLKGDDIHIYGRITAVADVFDALGSDRVYKKAWELDRILELFKKEKGEQFDPVLVDIFFANLEEFLKIRDSFPDRF